MRRLTEAQDRPGSPEAVAEGCTCPQIDNHHGEGRPSCEGRVWIISCDCPVHDSPAGRAAIRESENNG